MMRRTDTGHRTERGFTMIEMIVVLVLVALASIFVFPAITSMLRSSTRSAAMTSASGDGGIAERIMEHDIRGASAVRSMGDRADLGTDTSSVVDALNSTLPARHDILEATDTKLTLWTEAARTNPGPEQVTWELRQSRPECGVTVPNWCVVRSFQAGTPISEVIVRGRGAFPASIPRSPCGTTGVRIFCYQLSESVTAAGAPAYDWNGGWRVRGCRTRWATPSFSSTFGSGGWITNIQHNGFDNAVQVHQLDLITTISVVIPSGGGYANTTERTFSTTDLSLRSRQGEAYQRAIMCGAR